MSINLLPWRTLQIKRKIRFILGVMLSISVISICISAHFYFQERQQEKEESHQLLALKKHATSLETASIASLKETRPKSTVAPTSLAQGLLDFIQATPPGISLNHLSISKKEAIVEGFSSGRWPLELFIKQVSSLFKNSGVSIKTNDHQNQARFTLVIQREEKA
jgi:hypothetical protein